MRFKISVIAAGALGVALVAAGCGSTNNVSSSGTPGAGASASTAAVGFGVQNQQLCSASTAKPGYQNPVGTIAGGGKTLSGAGSTFVAPMLSDWAKTYNQSTGVQVSYQSIGSGGGIAQVQANTVDFGVADTGMKDSEIAAAKGPVVQVPLLFGAVVPAYHVSGIGSGLKFTGDVLGKIFAGKIKSWNDPALTAVNPGVKLPDEPIAVVHRSDASGTTAIFSGYLTKVSPTWVSALGGATQSSGKTIAWPTGIGGKGNEGVSGAVNQTEGAIGYVELQYALAQNITIGQVQNSSGAFIEPCIASASAAATGIKYPANLVTSFTDQSGPNAYPIAGSTYALIYVHQTSKAKAAALINFFAWVLTTGQDMTTDLHYAPLPADLQQLAYAELKTITVNGQPLVK
jgi:phosphate transport system substrate-binding protein